MSLVTHKFELFLWRREFQSFSSQIHYVTIHENTRKIPLSPVVNTWIFVSLGGNNFESAEETLRIKSGYNPYLYSAKEILTLW
jgi:hypothetical protein